MAKNAKKKKKKKERNRLNTNVPLGKEVVKSVIKKNITKEWKGIWNVDIKGRYLNKIKKQILKELSGGGIGRKRASLLS